jgi:hypothetical protein
LGLSEQCSKNYSLTYPKDLGSTAQAAQKGQGVVNKKQDELITIGFRAKPKEEAIIQGHVNRMYNEFVVDPNTKEPENIG